MPPEVMTLWVLDDQFGLEENDVKEGVLPKKLAGGVVKSSNKLSRAKVNRLPTLGVDCKFLIRKIGHLRVQGMGKFGIAKGGVEPRESD